jgi:hypothetical protein
MNTKPSNSVKSRDPVPLIIMVVIVLSVIGFIMYGTQS